MIMSTESNAPTSTPRANLHSFTSEGKEFKYPLLVKRYKATLIDVLLPLFTMVILMSWVDESAYRTPIMVTAGFIAFFMYEPVLTVYSRTVGQRLMRISVRQFQNPNRRINLFQAYARIAVKLSFGIISFVTVHFNPEHRALHDLTCGSVMIEE
jgi:uncharacterized RDD family membrane protein YckC